MENEMEDVIEFQRVVLDVPYLSDENNPLDWDWTSLCDSAAPVVVVRDEEVEL